MNDQKKQLFNDVYGEKYGKKQLPRIITPIRKKETNLRFLFMLLISIELLQRRLKKIRKKHYSQLKQSY